MKKKIISILVISAVIVVGISIYFNYGFKKVEPAPSSGNGNVKQEITLIIDNGEGSLKEFKAELNEKTTVFDLLKIKADESNLDLKTKTYDTGIMVEAINGEENGQEGKYWLYYVNGQMPMVAADKNELKAGDKVEFKFEKSPF